VRLADPVAATPDPPRRNLGTVDTLSRFSFRIPVKTSAAPRRSSGGAKRKIIAGQAETDQPKATAGHGSFLGQIVVVALGACHTGSDSIARSSSEGQLPTGSTASMRRTADRHHARP